VSLRVAFYSHNGFGLGHIGRNLKIARALLERCPNADVLIITGATGLDGMAIPAGVDYIKLPSVRKMSTGRWRPQSLDIEMERLLRLRKTMILEAIRAYRPHLFVADFLPVGVARELVPALEELAGRPDARSVIGLRDILDEPAVIRSAWEKEGSYAALEQLYDRVLVYGSPDWFDFSVYGVEPDLPRYVGLLGLEGVNGRHPRNGRNGRVRLLATCGGGADGYAMMAATLEASIMLQELCEAPVTCTVITGPLMPEPDVARLGALAERTGGRVQRFTNDFGAKLHQATAIVGMAGYNTVCEALSLRKPAVLVPRFGPSEEQTIRAQILSTRGLATHLPLAHCASDSMAAALAPLLTRHVYREDTLPDLNGLSKTVDSLLELVS